MADYTLPNGTVLRNVHDPALCAGRLCVIHNPSDHHMREWTMVWRDTKRVFERVCIHGVGHTDPDTPPDFRAVHGCDGCCVIR